MRIQAIPVEREYKQFYELSVYTYGTVQNTWYRPFVLVPKLKTYNHARRKYVNIRQMSGFLRKSFAGGLRPFFIASVYASHERFFYNLFLPELLLTPNCALCHGQK